MAGSIGVGPMVELNSQVKEILHVSKSSINGQATRKHTTTQLYYNKRI